MFFLSSAVLTFLLALVTNVSSSYAEDTGRSSTGHLRREQASYCGVDVWPGSLQLIDAVNDFRQAQGKSRLQTSISLIATAQAHVENRELMVSCSDSNLHSWGPNPVQTMGMGAPYAVVPCCESLGSPTYESCIFSKETEITSNWRNPCQTFVSFNGEIATQGAYTIESAMARWSNSLTLVSDRWQSVGCGYRAGRYSASNAWDSFYYCWFADKLDPNPSPQ